MSEVAVYTEPTQHGSALALSTDQDFWNEKQIATLRQMGLEKAGNGDLAVFMHVSQRTGLDPFAKQIYMIGRWSKDGTKYTIQTGIDGFRLIARRASDRLGETLEYEDTEWADSSGNWHNVWLKGTAPAAARVVVRRHGKRFPAVALYREYVQTFKDKATGELVPNSMWTGRPAGQLEKCAEALALRKAFPQDLSGIYADEEMGQADRPERRESDVSTPAADRMASILGTTTAEQVHDEPEPGPQADESPLLNTSSALAKRLFATLGEAGITDRDARLEAVSKIIGREVTSSSQMTDADAEKVIDSIKAALEQPFAENAS